jgi:large subunit ribosomal protein L22
MPGIKTNERPGTRAVLRHYRMSASKVRAVLDLIRGQYVDRATEILATTEREAASPVNKVLASAVANAVHNDGVDADDLFISACYADEGATLKRWRPRARGRATRIRKRTCHITIIVSRIPDELLERRREEREAAGAQRSRRVAESRRRADLAGRLSRRRHAKEEAEAAAAEAEGDEDEFDDDADGAGHEVDEAVDADEDEGENQEGGDEDAVEDETDDEVGDAEDEEPDEGEQEKGD